MNLWTYQNLSISLGNMKILKISRSNQKSGTPKMLIITYVFEEKTMLTLQDQNQQLQECLWLQSFLKSLMITMVEERWRTFSFWVWQGPRQHFEAQAMRDDHGALRKVDLPCSHGNVLKSAKSNMWTTPQTWDKNGCRQRETKPTCLNDLIRLTARTPCWQAAVWGKT